MRFARPRRSRRAAFLAALVLFAATPVLAANEPAAAPGITEDQVLAIVFDVAILRPMGFLQMMIGAAVLPVACLIALPSWALDLPGAPDREAMVDFMLKAPADHLFNRPLGELS